MSKKRTKRRGRESEPKTPAGAQRQAPPGDGDGRAASREALQVAPHGAPYAVRLTLTLGAACYLLMLLLGGMRSPIPPKILPPSLLYLTQSTCLFPRAALMAIDYRVEGWRCDERRFAELDPSPHFPIHADDKESRFQRVGHFHRRNRTVMRALERYLVSRERDAGADLGGIRVSSLRLPFPAPGEPVAAWSRPPLETIPSEQRRVWYYTPTSRRRAFCAGRDPDAPDDPAAGSAHGEARMSSHPDATTEPRRPRLDGEDEDEDDEELAPTTEVRVFDEELDDLFDEEAPDERTDERTDEAPR